MTKMQKRRAAADRLEQAAQGLIAQAYILCSPDGHNIHARQRNSAELLKRARQYANAVAAVRRS